MFTKPPVAREVRIDDLVGVSQLLTLPPGEAPFILAVLHEGDDLQGRVRLGPAGEISFRSPFAPSGPSRTQWTARARLRTTGRRFTRRYEVTVSVVLWRPDFGELLIRPTGRRAHGWGAARLERYGVLARLAADHLARRARELGQDAPTEAAAARTANPTSSVSSLAA